MEVIIIIILIVVIVTIYNKSKNSTTSNKYSDNQSQLNNIDPVMEMYSKQMGFHEEYLLDCREIMNAYVSLSLSRHSKNGADMRAKYVDDEVKVAVLICKVLNIEKSIEWKEKTPISWQCAIDNMGIAWYLSLCKPSFVFERINFNKENRSETIKKIIYMVIESYKKEEPIKSKEAMIEVEKSLFVTKMRETFDDLESKCGTEYIKVAQPQYDKFLDSINGDFVVVNYFIKHWFLVNLTNNELLYFNIGNRYEENPDENGFSAKIIDIPEPYSSAFKDYCSIFKNLGLAPHKIYDLYQGGIYYRDSEGDLKSYEDPEIYHTQVNISEELTMIIYAMIAKIDLKEIPYLTAYNSPLSYSEKSYLPITQKTLEKIVYMTKPLKIYDKLDYITKNKILSYCGYVAKPIYNKAFITESRELNDEEQAKLILMIHASILTFGYEIDKEFDVEERYLVTCIINCLCEYPLLDEIDNDLSYTEIKSIIKEYLAKLLNLC